MKPELKMVSLLSVAVKMGHELLSFWRRLQEHPSAFSDGLQARYLRMEFTGALRELRRTHYLMLISCVTIRLRRRPATFVYLLAKVPLQISASRFLADICGLGGGWRGRRKLTVL